MRCAVVERERACAAEIEALLTQAGHQVSLFNEVARFEAALDAGGFDLLVVRWGANGPDGADALAALRRARRSAPGALLIVRRDEEDIAIDGLTAGADDYVSAPLHPALFVARAEGAARRAQLRQPTRRLADFGRHLFDMASEMVLVDGVPVKLTSKEFALALTLFENMSRSVSRGHLLERIWGQAANTETRTLDAHVSRIRGKLNLRPAAGFRLSPVYSFGYRLERLSDLAERSGVRAAAASSVAAEPLHA